MHYGLGCLDASRGLFASANTHRVEHLHTRCYDLLHEVTGCHAGIQRARNASDDDRPRPQRATGDRAALCG